MSEQHLFDAGDPAQLDRVLEVDGEVTVRHVRDHPFRKRESRGCAECEGAKGALVHIGTPQSLNALVRQGNPHVYRGWKANWHERLVELLDEALLPRPLEHVHATGLLCFPTRTERDQGNFRVLLEKALGDALVAGGWLPDDHWDYFEFGDLRRTYARGEAWTEVTLRYALSKPQKEEMT